MPFCPKCGKEVQPGSEFCASYGFRIGTVANPQPGPPPAVTTSDNLLGSYKGLVAAILGLIGLVVIGIGAGIYAIPGYNQAYNYCAYPNSYCDSGRSMIVDGAILIVVGLILLMFAAFIFFRKRAHQ